MIDERLKDCVDSCEILAEEGLIKQLTKAIIERGLEPELGVHQGCPNAFALDLFGFGVYTSPQGAARALSFHDPLEGTETKHGRGHAP